MTDTDPPARTTCAACGNEKTLWTAQLRNDSALATDPTRRGTAPPLIAATTWRYGTTRRR